MAEKKTYTPQGFKALQDELDYLVNVRVEENKKEISTARAFGDLSENSEYDEAKQEQEANIVQYMTVFLYSAAAVQNSCKFPSDDTIWKVSSYAS